MARKAPCPAPIAGREKALRSLPALASPIVESGLAQPLRLRCAGKLSVVQLTRWVFSGSLPAFFEKAPSTLQMILPAHDAGSPFRVTHQRMRHTQRTAVLAFIGSPCVFAQSPDTAPDSR